MERKGLVKIGYAGGKPEGDGDPVYRRVKSYATGIPDNSIVHKTLGAQVFEKYLHWLVSGDQKEIDIRFLENQYKPREWFELPPEKLKILIEAFAAEPPKSLDAISEGELPVFFSGLFSAINWHAKSIGQKNLSQADEEEIEQEEMIAKAIRKSMEENDQRIADLKERLNQAQSIAARCQQKYHDLSQNYTILNSKTRSLLQERDDLSRQIKSLRQSPKAPKDYWLWTIGFGFVAIILLIVLITYLLGKGSVGGQSQPASEILDLQPREILEFPLLTPVPTPTPVEIKYQISLDSPEVKNIQYWYTVDGATFSLENTINNLRPIVITATIERGEAPWIFVASPDGYFGKISCSISIGREIIEKSVSSGNEAGVYCSTEPIK